MHASPAFHGTWNDTRCDLAKPYVCKISSETPPPTPAPGDGECLPFWVPYGSYCYYVYNGQTGFSWPDARHYCQQFGTELLSLHSRAEVEFVRNLNYTKYHNVWIGLTRDRNFGWGWTDATSLGFLNWAAGEPNTAFHPGEVGEESCVEMYPDGRWNDNNCMQKRGFGCRRRQHNAAAIGGVAAACVIFVVVAGLLFYVFRVRGYKLSGLSLPTRTSRTSSPVDVPTFSNPNFSGESDS
ncbi:Asialoglycoprotein receptor 2 [Liparis tanakae]|uniref:Asialoglycoprotein receptor 2 n=1 Tax=Liparis tanakae TaxID=230148 RepID=A0A4Z2EH18_9TELE|nr:Asialoglycoprotein receptor 2 [Liparis tanakae]